MRYWLAGLVALAIASGLCLALISIPMAGRVAIVEFGLAEKLVVQHIVWPLLDRDDDGFAGSAWGTDCDDNDPGVRPDRPPFKQTTFGCKEFKRRVIASGNEANEVVKPSKNLVWIMIDTWRADAPKEMPRAFGSFVRLSGFRSCGSRTQEVLRQLLQGPSCPPGNQDVPTTLREHGYEIGVFTQYDSVTYGMPASVYGTPQLVLDKTQEWIRERSTETAPYFAFVHLVGGHAPYLASGRTPRERYENQLHHSVAAAGEFIDSLDDDAVVLVMGDHGEEFGEHEARTHASSLYEEVLATPVYLRTSSQTGAAESRPLGCAHLSRLIVQALSGKALFVDDDVPTLATLYSPRGVHGGLSHTALYALRFDESWKVIWRPRLGIWELYDLGHDPKELHNLADARPAMLRSAASELLALIDACDGLMAPSQTLGREEPTASAVAQDAP